MNKPTGNEINWKVFAEDMLISAYVPNADQLSRADALELAIQRDQEAAFNLQQDCQDETILPELEDISDLNVEWVDEWTEAQEIHNEIPQIV